MSAEEKVRQTIFNTSRKVAKEVAASLNVECDPDALDIIAELTYKKLHLYGKDLDAFQKHGKRSTITTDDIKLLVRRNESLREMVDSKLKARESLKPSESATGSKRKRKPTTSASSTS